MKRFAITEKIKIVGHNKLVIPVINVLYFNFPVRTGSYYCADNGTLWSNINDGQWIFDDENDAKKRLAEIIEELFALKTSVIS